MLVARHLRLLSAVLVAASVAAACSSAPAAEPLASERETIDPGPEPSASSETPSETETPTAALAFEPIQEAPAIVRGIYSHVYSFWGENWNNLIDIVKTTEVNAIVVDVKDEAGTLLWNVDLPLVEAGGADWKQTGDPTEKLKMLTDAGGWPIARIACFKDTLVATARPDLAVQDQAGNTWKGNKDFSWLNPYQDEAGQWCIDVGLKAVEMGFREVQFDYIRFPNGGDGDTSNIALPGVPDDRPREEWRHTGEITEFLASASEQIHAAGGYVSADLFGLVTYDFSWDAQGTGQVLEQIAEHVDFISPMVYPSHYGPGNYGLLPHPVDFPYETVWNSMQEAQMRTQGEYAQIRPWLEDFGAGWLGRTHSPARLTEQMNATYDNGIDGWLLWNAANKYSLPAIATGEAVSKADPNFVPPARTANPDEAPNTIPQRTWPGEAECDTREGRLFIGEGNLAGTKPGIPSPAPVEPNADGTCPGDETEEPTETSAPSETSTPSAPSSSSTSESEAADS